MIIGIGVDIESVDRFRRIRKPVLDRIVKRILTEREKEYCYRRRDPAPCIAARFCAKEALLKALSTARFIGITWRDMEVVGRPPRLRVKGRLKSLLKEKKVGKIHLSITHSGGYAVAVVVLEG